MKKLPAQIIFIFLIAIVFSVMPYAADGEYSARITDFLGRPYTMTALAVISVILLLVATILFVRLRRITRKINFGKLTDADTGIGNLAYFERRFHEVVKHKYNSRYYIAYVVIDGDRLRASHDEATFSDVVKRSAKILKSFCAEGDFCARISESGFAFAFSSKQPEQAQNMVSRLNEKLNSYVSENRDDVHPVFHTAVYNLSDDDDACESILFNLRRNCNKILNSSKSVVFCNKHAMNSVTEERRLLDSISEGLDREEFKMYLQFSVENVTGKIVSAEALSRWHNPERGVVFPGEYIGVMESSGLITRFDFYMFRNVCNLLEKWTGTEFDDVSVSCNFTRITISDIEFVDKIRDIIKDYTFDKSKLIIEVTEDATEKDRELNLNNIRACKNIGFSIALDDMGSGYTSLIDLCEYPIDIVKIDRQVLIKASSAIGKRLFKGIVALAHSLDIKTVCEGVETKEQNDFVALSDCNFIQGWYYHKAMPIEECEKFVLHNKM